MQRGVKMDFSVPKSVLIWTVSYKNRITLKKRKNPFLVSLTCAIVKEKRVKNTHIVQVNDA